MNEIISKTLMLVGVAFLLVAAVGVLRMPDLFTRMQASAKASTLGAGLVMLGVALHFSQIGITSRAVLVVAFLALTAPVSAHLIARAAYFIGVPLWSGSVRDDLREHYQLVRSEMEIAETGTGVEPPE